MKRRNSDTTTLCLFAFYSDNVVAALSSSETTEPNGYKLTFWTSDFVFSDCTISEAQEFTDETELSNEPTIVNWIADCGRSSSEHDGGTSVWEHDPDNQHQTFTDSESDAVGTTAIHEVLHAMLHGSGSSDPCGYVREMTTTNDDDLCSEHGLGTWDWTEDARTPMTHQGSAYKEGECRYCEDGKPTVYTDKLSDCTIESVAYSWQHVENWHDCPDDDCTAEVC